MNRSFHKSQTLRFYDCSAVEVKSKLAATRRAARWRGDVSGATRGLLGFGAVEGPRGPGPGEGPGRAASFIAEESRNRAKLSAESCRGPARGTSSEPAPVHLHERRSPLFLVNPIGPTCLLCQSRLGSPVLPIG
ncbi:hypothetical protein J1605_010399 [Eschrichtius robustus]|uniref:Uncharacterized protein n=1 Tax=Eschrichtius robustus TaxID=9764 RepID=A0AB34GNT0_ESCRO|nr:hypothetical protein J1605_010399 [Eschrichtius robustus]